MASIELSNLSFQYTDRRQTRTVFSDLNLHIADGEFLCLIGPSGCGKSTLLRLLAGLAPAAAGEVRIDGSVVRGPGADRMIVFQDYALFPWMTARKNVAFAVLQAHRGMSQAEATDIAEDFLARVGMQDAMDLYPSQLSGGMCQRVAIARALAMDTDILLLDEPFGALDARIRTELQGMLERLWQNEAGKRKTVVFVTHDIQEALLLGDRIVFLRPGQIVADLPVHLPRPRRDVDLCRLDEFVFLKKTLLELFYQNPEEVCLSCV
ncbi:MAG: ABC transporter ATP-binding protein [Butyricicoccus sp.]